MKFIFIAIIRFYRFVISPLLGKNCRFYPTCSDYAIQAIEKYGAVKGGWMAVRRVSKCHPYHKGDFHDPLP